jgi:hypothetical protein
MRMSAISSACDSCGRRAAVTQAVEYRRQMPASDAEAVCDRGNRPSLGSILVAELPAYGCCQAHAPVMPQAAKNVRSAQYSVAGRSRDKERNCNAKDSATALDVNDNVGETRSPCPTGTVLAAEHLDVHLRT